MGLKNYINNKIDDFVEKSIERKAKKMNNYIDRQNKTFDRFYRRFEDSYTSYKQKECEVLYSGSADLIERFYKQVKAPLQVDITNFYTKVDGSTPRISSGVAALVSDTMGSLVFKDMPKMEVDTLNEAQNVILNDRLKTLFKESNLFVYLHKAAVIESYSGEVGFRFIIDSDISDKPLIEVYEASRIIPNYKYGKLITLTFIDIIVEDGKEYELHSIYGKGFIDYVLYNGEDEIKLNRLNATKDLRPLIITDKNGKRLNITLAVHKINKNSYIYNSERAKPDFYDQIEEIVQIDETSSAKSDYIRKNKTTRFISENILGIDDATGENVEFNDWTDTTTVVTGFKMGQNYKEEFLVETITPDLNALPLYDATINAMISDVLVKCGISPSTVGLIDNIGANQTAESLKIREKVTLNTRDNKLALWRITLPQIVRLLLIYEDIMETAVLNNDTINGSIVDSYDYNYVIDYSDITSNDFETKLDTYLKGVDILYTKEYAIKNLFGRELSEDDLNAMINELNAKKTIPELE